ncbi:hypothetical protein Nepgr_032737 [Nepenthes gracilis]|uniref:Uncharacterized protein n=1 Tax=Nepenthes gracilis TaxID=150966 RepID=A0AAD3TKJ5_NEPGR|nr:hypothetical protein Nepgr_032737 [Nepenthes gracilis]
MFARVDREILRLCLHHSNPVTPFVSLSLPPSQKSNAVGTKRTAEERENWAAADGESMKGQPAIGLRATLRRRVLQSLHSHFPLPCPFLRFFPSSAASIVALSPLGEGQGARQRSLFRSSAMEICGQNGVNINGPQ